MTIQKSTIKETTPKSRIERIHRHLRSSDHDPSTHQNIATHRTASLPGRIVVKKTANNDPKKRSKRSNRNIPAPLTETIRFLYNNVGKSGIKLEQAVRSFDNIDNLSEIARHMIAVSLGGWYRGNGKFINEDGHEASPSNWNLCEGRLVSKNGCNANFNIDWLLELRRYCDAGRSRS
jgi:hypothetical protein